MINKEKKDLCFSEDHHITKVASADGFDLIDLLNLSMSYARRTIDPKPLEINVTINCPSTDTSHDDAEDASTKNAFYKLMSTNRVEMSMLKPNYN